MHTVRFCSLYKTKQKSKEPSWSLSHRSFPKIWWYYTTAGPGHFQKFLREKKFSENNLGSEDLYAEAYLWGATNFFLRYDSFCDVLNIYKKKIRNPFIYSPKSIYLIKRYPLLQSAQEKGSGRVCEVHFDVCLSGIIPMVSSLWRVGPPFITNDLFSSLLGGLSADDLAYWLNLAAVQECIPSTGSYLPSEAISHLITGQYWQWMLQPWLLWWNNSSRLIHHHISPEDCSESGIKIELQINFFFLTNY